MTLGESSAYCRCEHRDVRCAEHALFLVRAGRWNSRPLAAGLPRQCMAQGLIGSYLGVEGPGPDRCRLWTGLGVRAEQALRYYRWSDGKRAAAKPPPKTSRECIACASPRLRHPNPRADSLFPIAGSQYHNVRADHSGISTAEVWVILGLAGPAAATKGDQA